MHANIHTLFNWGSFDLLDRTKPDKNLPDFFMTPISERHAMWWLMTESKLCRNLAIEAMHYCAPRKINLVGALMALAECANQNCNRWRKLFTMFVENCGMPWEWRFEQSNSQTPSLDSIHFAKVHYLVRDQSNQDVSPLAIFSRGVYVGLNVFLKDVDCPIRGRVHVFSSATMFVQHRNFIDITIFQNRARTQYLPLTSTRPANHFVTPDFYLDHKSLTMDNLQRIVRKIGRSAQWRKHNEQWVMNVIYNHNLTLIESMTQIYTLMLRTYTAPQQPAERNHFVSSHLAEIIMRHANANRNTNTTNANAAATTVREEETTADSPWKQLQLLDFGGGNGDVLAALQEEFQSTQQYTCIETATDWQEQYLFNHPTIRYCFWDNESIDTVATASQDVVLCMVSLHHMKPDVQEKALSEITRVLKPGGLLILKEHHAVASTVTWLIEWEHRLYHLLDMCKAAKDNKPLIADHAASIRHYLRTNTLLVQPRDHWEARVLSLGFESIHLADNTFNASDEAIHALDSEVGSLGANPTKLYWQVFRRHLLPLPSSTL